MVKVDRLFKVMLISSLVLAAAGCFYILSIVGTGEEFTEFYLLGPDEIFQNNPVRVRVNEHIRFLLGIVNHENSGITYNIEMKVSGESWQKADLLYIDKGEKREINMDYQPVESAKNCKIEFILSKDAAREPYRQLYLWLDIQ